MIRADINELIAFLNDLAKIDPVAMGALIRHRVPCNDALAKHPTVQAGPAIESNEIVVGILGILNGYGGTIDEPCDRKGWGMICATVEADGRCTGFSRTAY